MKEATFYHTVRCEAKKVSSLEELAEKVKEDIVAAGKRSDRYDLNIKLRTIFTETEDQTHAFVSPQSCMGRI